MIKRHALLIIAATIALAATAQGSSAAYSFLDIPLSSRIYGLGGLNISLVDDDVTTTDQNPALLGPEMDGQVSLAYMHYINESNFAGLQYARAAGEYGAWSASLRYFGYGSMIEADETGAQIGEISAKDAVFSGAYSHNITENLRGGISMKFIYSAYAEYSAFAVSTDLGLNYFNPDKDQSFSLVIANLGGQIKRFNNTYDRLPFDIRLGWSQTFGTLPLRFSVTAWNLTKWHSPYYKYGDGTSSTEIVKTDSFSSNLFRHLVFGVDIVSSPNWYLGLGYNYKSRTDMQTYHRSFVSGFSLSGGIRVTNFSVGVAFAQPHTGATTMMLNLTANLGELL